MVEGLCYPEANRRKYQHEGAFGSRGRASGHKSLLLSANSGSTFSLSQRGLHCGEPLAQPLSCPRAVSHICCHRDVAWEAVRLQSIKCLQETNEGVSSSSLFFHHHHHSPLSPPDHHQLSAHRDPMTIGRHTALLHYHPEGKSAYLHH